MTIVINIIGAGRRSGKTTLVEAITKKLSRRFTIWTVKHISTSFDTADKDTWRHLHAGAEGVIAITNHEQIIIKRDGECALEKALVNLPENVNLLLVEGFKGAKYPKIVVAHNTGEVRELLPLTSKVFAVYLPEIGQEARINGIALLDLDALILKIEALILSDVVKKLPGLDCKSCGFPTCEALAKAILKNEATLEKCKVIIDEEVTLIVDGKRIHLSPFPRTLIKKAVLGMIGSLKGIDVSTNRTIQLNIKI